MKSNNEIKNIIVAGKEYTALVLGPEKNGIPKHLLQGERKEGLIVEQESITPFYWLGTVSDDKYQYLYFPKCNLESLDTISTKNRKNALNLVEEIAYGLLNAPSHFLNLENGFFPLYRIYILDKEKIVLLPPDASDIIAISKMGEYRDKNKYSLYKKGCEKSYSLILEMSELLYLAITGTLPFSEKSVQTSNSKHIPVSWYNEKENKLYSFVDYCLSLNDKDQRKLGGNKRPEQNLAWFLSQTSQMEWDDDNRSEEDEEKNIKEHKEKEEFKNYYLKAENKARIIDFWRAKGALILTLTIIIGVSLFLLINFTYNALKPPLTKDLNQIELIMALYDSQNSLDSNHLNDAVKGELPQSNEVLNLFVNKQTRMAYEQINPLVKAEDWIDAGMPEIMDTAFIYGVVPSAITQIDDTSFIAEGTWYTPYAYNSEDDENGEYKAPEGTTAIYVYDIDQTFKIIKNKRGWYEVIESDLINTTLKERILVKTYPKTKTQILPIS